MDGSGNSGKRKNSYTPNEGCLVFFKAKTCSAGACDNPGLYTTCGHLIKPRTVFIQSKDELQKVASSYAADPVTIFLSIRSHRLCYHQPRADLFFQCSLLFNLLLTKSLAIHAVQGTLCILYREAIVTTMGHHLAHTISTTKAH